MMKVLKIIHTMGHGGAENIFRWLARQLMDEGVEVIAGIPSGKDPRHTEDWITPALEELDIPYETFEERGTSREFLKNLARLTRRIEPDLVHSHLLDSNFYSAVACRRLSIPHACTEHGDLSIGNSVTTKIKFGLLSLATNALVCVSENVKRAASRCALDSRKLLVVHNGIRFPEEKPSTFRRECAIPEGALLVGNVGNLYAVKAQDLLIRAFSRFLEIRPDAYLVIVGRGQERESLERLVRELRIPERQVIFTGFRGDVANILAGIDIYVQPSRSEGLPVALLEAMSFGIPVIATDVGGMPEVIGSDEHGILVRAGSSETLHDGLAKVAGRLDFYRNRAARSREHVRDRYSLSGMAAKYLGVYENILKTGRRPS